MWTKDEIKLLKKLSTPFKIQDYVFHLGYNSDSATSSPRVVMKRKTAHCFEGALFAAAALEFHGYKPLIMDLLAFDHDDDHVIALYQEKGKWGSISKTNTTTAGMRLPFYRSPRELAMSYFDFYFNVHGYYSLNKFSKPINLNRLNAYEWRTTPNDLIEMGYELNDFPHEEILKKSELKKLPRAYKKVVDGTFFKSVKKGLFQP